MSRWHRDNPELYEAGYDPMEEALAAADYARKAEREGAYAQITVTLDESENPATLHEVARIALECDDAPLAHPTCHVCGSQTQQTGSCHTCPRCGETTGCG